MVFSPVFGYYGDRSSRKVLLAIGITLWSIFGCLGSFATVRWPSG